MRAYVPFVGFTARRLGETISSNAPTVEGYSIVRGNVKCGRKEKDPELPSIHDPQDRFTARWSRADRFLRTGDGPSAADELIRIKVEFDMQQHCPYAQLAFALILQQRFDDALPLLQQAVKLPLSDGETLDNYACSDAIIGDILQRKNDPQGATEAVQKALTIDPNQQQAKDVVHVLISLV